jgi:heme exporter protein A
VETILFVSRRGDPRGRRHSAMLTHRASRLTKRAAAAAKPEGAGGFAPMPSDSGSAVPTGTPFARTLGLAANPPRQNASTYEDHALGSPFDEHNETKQNSLQGLTTHSLACIRGERAVFAGLDLQVKPGRALLLSGANGSGKSSLLRVLAGLLPAAGGRITWEGTDIAEDSDAHRARVAYVGHADPLKPSMTATENLRFWAQLYGLDPDVEPALFQFSIEHLADVPARYFSAGQLWLLDEPATGLDPGAVSMLANTILAHLSNEGVAIISTHGGRLDALLADHADHVTMQTSQDGFPG